MITVIQKQTSFCYDKHKITVFINYFFLCLINEKKLK